MKPIHIPVTPDHIRKGIRQNPDSCPLAHAIQDRLGPVCKPIQVGDTHTALTIPSRRAAVALENSPPVTRLLHLYDTKGHMAPFTLILDLDARRVTTSKDISTPEEQIRP